MPSRERGTGGAQIDRGGGSGFIPSFFQQPFNGLLPNQTWQLFRERDRASDHLEACGLSYLCRCQTKEFRRRGLGAGLKRKSHFSRQN